MQQAIDNLVKFSNTTGVKISKLKTEAIIFKKQLRKSDKVQLKIKFEYIKTAKQIKICGLIFDCPLNWKPHVEYLRTHCLNRINILKALSDKKWGAKQRVLVNIYKSLIQSKIDYGCSDYGSASNNTLNRLEPILNSCMRIATGAYRISPTFSILSESDVIFLSLKRKS